MAVNGQPGWRTPALIVGTVVLCVAAGLLVEVMWTRPERESVRTFSELISAANTQDMDHARTLCSARYLSTHTLRPSPEGGIVGLPRNIHKNFQVWRRGEDVWLCPTNR